jgi:hypothetical protein
MPSHQSSDPSGLQNVSLTLCRECLEGKGGECHTPGCALWMSAAPDIPILDKTTNPAEDYSEAYWRGFYNACKLLGTSPRMNKPQREVITEQGYRAKDELEKLGVNFAVAQEA